MTTQADYTLANAVIGYLSSIPDNLYPSANALAVFIAAHRAEPTALTVSQGQMTTDSARPHVVADPAQAHAQELENFLVFFRSILYEFRKRTPNRWSPTAERKYSEMDALLSTLERERKAQKGTT